MNLGWLRRSPGNNTRAFCVYCKTELTAHKERLKEHAATKKHLDNVKANKECTSLPKITTFAKATIDEKRKRGELKLAAFVAEHCSIRTIDHLSAVITDLDKSSEVLSQIKLHRTKCSGTKY